MEPLNWQGIYDNIFMFFSASVLFAIIMTVQYKDDVENSSNKSAISKCVRKIKIWIKRRKRKSNQK